MRAARLALHAILGVGQSAFDLDRTPRRPQPQEKADQQSRAGRLLARLITCIAFIPSASGAGGGELPFEDLPSLLERVMVEGTALQAFRGSPSLKRVIWEKHSVQQHALTSKSFSQR